MKKHLLRISMIAALAAAAGQAETYFANVPFNFRVGSQTAPAGKYEIDASASSKVVVIRSADNKEKIAVIAGNAISLDCGSMDKLVFHRYGNRYFLEEMWTRGSNTGRRLPQGPLERELKAQRNVHKTQATVALR